jgi:hypothetical protein
MQTTFSCTLAASLSLLAIGSMLERTSFGYGTNDATVRDFVLDAWLRFDCLLGVCRQGSMNVVHQNGVYHE